MGSIEGYQTQVFHYQPKVHALEQLWEIPREFDMGDIFASMTEKTVVPAAGIIFTAVWEHTACKYGDFGYNLALLEAGHMAQNVLLMAAALSVNATPVGGFHDNMVHEILDIDGNAEQAVYTIALF